MAAIGDVFADRYELQARLGRGGMAEVFRAHDHRLGRRVAVKVLADDMLADPRSVERFRREARSAASLSHPHIVNVYDAASDGDTHFIVMELLEGPTLADRIHEQGRLAPSEALPIAADIADALEAAHRRGLVHHDVKPRNVLFDDEGTAKVADFGIARAASSAITTLQGSPPYVAPEQARGGQADPRSDIYALGCTLFEMLAGRPPFTGDSASQVIMQHIEAPRPSLSDFVDDVDRDVDAIVQRALAREPEQRHESAGALRDELRRVADGLPISDATRSATMLLPADATTAVASDDGTIYGQSSPPPVYEPTDYVDDPYRDDTYRDDDRWSQRPRRSRARTVLVGIVVLLLALVALAAWADGRFGGDEPADVVTQPDADSGQDPEADPAPEPEPEPEPAEPDPGAPDDSGTAPSGLAGRLQDLVDRGRDAAGGAGERIGDRVEQEIADTIQRSAEQATSAQLDRLEERVDDLEQNGRIGGQLADQLRTLIDDARPAGSG